MESVSSVQKFLQPTVSVAIIALFVDAISITAYGRSPAYADLSQIIGEMAPDIGYFVIVLTLTFVVLALPALSLAFAANALAYHILLWPFKRMRIMRVHARFLRRQMIDRDLAIAYARYHSMSELADQLTEDLRRLGRSPLQPFIPMIIILLTTYLAIVSSPTHPNFLMKVCSLDAPVQSCESYKFVLALIYVQAILLMALNHQIFRSQRWYPKSALPIPASELLRFGRRAHKDRFSEARASWMRPKSLSARAGQEPEHQGSVKKDGEDH